MEMKAKGVKAKTDLLFLLNTNRTVTFKCFLYAFLSNRTMPAETEEPNGEVLKPVHLKTSRSQP